LLFDDVIIWHTAATLRTGQPSTWSTTRHASVPRTSWLTIPCSRRHRTSPVHCAMHASSATTSPSCFSRTMHHHQCQPAHASSPTGHNKYIYIPVCFSLI